MGFGVVKRDILREPVDAMVNITDKEMSGNANILDRLVHEAGGPRLKKELLEVMSNQEQIETGSTVVTRSYGIKPLYIIHTPGPLWVEGANGKADEFSLMIQNCLDRAAEKNFKSLAFGSIQDAELGFPSRLAIALLMQKASEWRRINRRSPLKGIYFALTNPEEYKLFRTAQAVGDSDSLLSLPNLTGDDVVWKLR